MASFDLKNLYYERASVRSPYWNNFLQSAINSGVQASPIQNHWTTSPLSPDSISDWAKTKRTSLILGVKKEIYVRENGRSTDYIAPSHANGCTAACSYCYVARRKMMGNPITLFTNFQEGIDFVSRHATKLGAKAVPNQCDPKYWIYDIGENSDCSVDSQYSPAVSEYVKMFAKHPFAKGSFATKFVNPDLLNLSPEKKTRIRFSLMPESTSRVVDVRTDSIQKRLDAIVPFSDAGWEVHLNLSPVIVYQGWMKDYEELFNQINDAVPEALRAEVKAEVIFLTHNAELHDLNMKWHPRGEDYLWAPGLQEPKVSQTGGNNLRYRWQKKQVMISMFTDLLAKVCPWLEIRYIF